MKNVFFGIVFFASEMIGQEVTSPFKFIDPLTWKPLKTEFKYQGFKTPKRQSEVFFGINKYGETVVRHSYTPSGKYYTWAKVKYSFVWLWQYPVPEPGQKLLIPYPVVGTGAPRQLKPTTGGDAMGLFLDGLTWSLQKEFLSETDKLIPIRLRPSRIIRSIRKH